MSDGPAAPGYLVIRCDAPGCRSGCSAAAEEALRECVRVSRYGVLIQAGCVCGDVTCRGRATGSMIVVQPCAADLAPHGPAVLIGPLAEVTDVDAVRACLRGGRFDAGGLPSRLLALHRRRAWAVHN